MTATLTAPHCRDDVERMTVTRLLIAEGSVFGPDTPLYEIEVDKTITEVSASAPGKLRKWLVAEGDLVTVGQPLADIDGDHAREADAAPLQSREPPAHGQPPRSPWHSQATLCVQVAWDRVDAALRSAVRRPVRDRPTTTTILAECLRQALHNRRALWKIQAGDGRLLAVSSLSLGIAVARDDGDLTTAVVDALEPSVDEFTRRVRSAVSAARAGRTKSLRNVPIVISDLSLYGIRHGVPAVVPPSIGTVLLGEAYPCSGPGQSAAGGRCANLTLSFDHRCINGVGAAGLLADLKRRLETFRVTGESGCGRAPDITEELRVRRDADIAGAAAGSTEQALRAMLCELLAVATVAPASTLWSLGADSAMAADLAARINARFEVGLLIHDIYENPTLLELRDLILRETRPRDVTAPPLPTRGRCDPAPLTYRQEGRWQDFRRLGMARNSRSIARAFRLRGPLEAGRLGNAVDELVRRHEALRTRIVEIDGVPMQVVDDSSTGGLQLIDLQGLPEDHRDQQARRLVEELVNEPLDMATGPLFGARLLKVGRDEHIFAFAADHIVADRVSADLMEREIHGLYGLESGDLPPAPGPGAQLADHVLWQRQTRQAWLERHGAYWSARLERAPRLLLPHDRSAAAGSGCWRMAPIDMDENLRELLQEFSRRENSTVALTVLTAYIALVLHWCAAREATVAVMTDGRARPEIRHTVGFFASELYLRVQLGAHDSFQDLHRQVRREYGGALRHQDFGLLPGLMPQAGLAACPSFNWHQTDSAPALRHGCGESVKAQPFAFRKEGRELDVEGELSIFGGQPWVSLTDDSARITGRVLYRPNQFGEDTMAQFARNLARFAQRLALDPNGRLAGFPAPPGAPPA